MSDLVVNEKSQFVENIQKWVSLDNQLKIINEKMKKARIYKNELIDQITNYAVYNELQDRKIEISDGELRFYDKKDYQPITFSYIEDCLQHLITDERHVEYIMKYLRENRKITVSKDIRRIYKNRAASFS
jgi:hypothetical protein